MHELFDWASETGRNWGRALNEWEAKRFNLPNDIEADYKEREEEVNNKEDEQES